MKKSYIILFAIYAIMMLILFAIYAIMMLIGSTFMSLSEALTLAAIFIGLGIFMWAVESRTLFNIYGIPTILSSYWMGMMFVIAMIGVVAAYPDFSKGDSLFVFFEGAWSTIWRILFAYVFLIIHEYGHALTAKRFGYKTESITLYPFSGLALIEGNWYENYKHEFWIAIMGPMTNFVMALLLLPFIYAGYANQYLVWFFEINVILLAFNAIPIYPMDGGRIMRCFLTSKMGWEKATKYALNATLCFAALFAPVLWIYWSPIGAILVGAMALLGQTERSLLRQAKTKRELEKYEAELKKVKEDAIKEDFLKFEKTVMEN